MADAIRNLVYQARLSVGRQIVAFGFLVAPDGYYDAIVKAIRATGKQR